MACGACAARRRRLLEAAKAKSYAQVAIEGAKGAAEMLALKNKTALEDDAMDAAALANKAEGSSE